MDISILVLLTLDYLYFLGCLFISALNELLVDVDILTFNLGGNLYEPLTEFSQLFVHLKDGLGIKRSLVLFYLVLDSFHVIDFFHDFVFLTFLWLFNLLLVEKSQEVLLEVKVLNIFAVKECLKKSFILGNEFTPVLE
jgi:hypothetical protein